MPSPYDVIVVGSGPAGGTAARYAARRGLKVLLVDKRKEIGVPVQCGEYVAHNEEVRSIFPDVEGLEDLMAIPYHVREVDTPVIRFWSPKEDTHGSFRRPIAQTSAWERGSTSMGTCKVCSTGSSGHGIWSRARRPVGSCR